MSMVVIVHCSDIHCNHILANNTFPWYHWKAYAHDIQLCMAMPAALEKVRVLTELSDDEEPYVVVSGDLTVQGAAGEFAVAHALLNSRWQVALSPLAPHGPAGPPLETVGGNHDQWSGNRYMMWGRNPTLAGMYFRHTPWVEPWGKNPLSVELFGIDSNAGLSASIPNWIASGDLDLSRRGEWQKLLTRINASTARVRILMLHHSPVHRGWSHYLTTASLAELKKLAVSGKIHAVLTGHLHTFHPDQPGPPTDLELRSASTLQGPADRAKKKPGFWAHKIWLDGSKVRWTAWKFLWVHPTGFFPEDKPSVDFVIP